jgi:hypothetical protein
MKFQFGNVVVVENNLIGVVVKSWGNNTHDVYIRSSNLIWNYKECKIKHFVYSKELTEDQLEFYK